MIIFGKEYYEKQLKRLPRALKQAHKNAMLIQASQNKRTIESERKQFRDLYDEIQRLKNT